MSPAPGRMPTTTHRAHHRADPQLGSRSGQIRLKSIAARVRPNETGYQISAVQQCSQWSGSGSGSGKPSCERSESQLPSSEAEKKATIIPTMPADQRSRHITEMRLKQRRHEAAKRQLIGQPHEAEPPAAVSLIMRSERLSFVILCLFLDF